MTTIEKRHYRRVPMGTQIKAEAGGKTFSMEACNISVGGMLIKTPRTLEEKQNVKLEFTLPGSDHALSVQGTVQHVSPGAFMGVAFDDLAPEHRAAIVKYVNEATA